MFCVRAITTPMSFATQLQRVVGCKSKSTFVDLEFGKDLHSWSPEGIRIHRSHAFVYNSLDSRESGSSWLSRIFDATIPRIENVQYSTPWNKYNVPHEQLTPARNRRRRPLPWIIHVTPGRERGNCISGAVGRSNDYGPEQNRTEPADSTIITVYIYNIYIYIPYHDKYHQIDWCKSVLPHVSVQMLRLGTVSPGASYDTYDTPTKGIEVPPPFPSPNAFSTEGRVRISLVCGSMGPNVHAHSTWDAQQLGARLTISSSDRMNPIPSAVPSVVAELNITYTYEMKSRDGKSQREEKSRKEKIREEKESEKESEERRCRCAKR